MNDLIKILYTNSWNVQKLWNILCHKNVLKFKYKYFRQWSLLYENLIWKKAISKTFGSGDFIFIIFIVFVKTKTELKLSSNFVDFCNYYHAYDFQPIPNRLFVIKMNHKTELITQVQCNSCFFFTKIVPVYDQNYLYFSLWKWIISHCTSTCL